MCDNIIDCTEFVHDFFCENEQITSAMFGPRSEYDGSPDPTPWCLICNINEWKRTERRRPNAEDSFPLPEDRIGVFLDGVAPECYGETTGSIATSDVVWVHTFECGDEFDIVFLVLETKDNLFLGPYRG